MAPNYVVLDVKHHHTENKKFTPVRHSVMHKAVVCFPPNSLFLTQSLNAAEICLNQNGKNSWYSYYRALFSCPETTSLRDKRRNNNSRELTMAIQNQKNLSPLVMAFYS